MPLLHWKPRPLDTPVIAPDERLSWPQTCAMGVQHLVAMFGSTVLVPLLMGFDPNGSILMSGVGTLLFFLITGGRVPSYLGSSFSFIGVTLALTSYAGGGPNPQIGLALGGLLACGAVYALVGAVVHLVGSGWIERFMPPVVTGTVVAAIGLGLAAVPVKNMTTGPFDAWMQAVTFVCVALIAVFTGGLLRRLMILAGLLAASVIYAALANGLGLGKPIDLSAVAAAPWLGMPQWQHPVLSAKAALLYVPIVVVLVAENLGHLKAVAAMTGRNLDADTGKAFLADGLATMASAGMGGNGVTTYAENIGVMGATRIYSTAIFPVTAAIAIVLGFSPKFGALLQAIPVPVIGGVSIVVFGLITVAGAKIWVDNRVDFTDIRNVLVAAIALTLGTGGFTLQFGDFTLEGIGTATFGAIALNWLLHRGAGTPARPPH